MTVKCSSVVLVCYLVMSGNGNLIFLNRFVKVWVCSIFLDLGVVSQSYVLCLLQGNINAGTDFVMRESEDPIQTPNR
jgi:hypothetical protein